MSSSSSLAGARRRRAGGGSGPTSSGQPQQRPPNPSTQPQTDPQQVNPFMLLQQHNMKINMIEQTVREFMVNRESNMKNDNNNTNTNNNSIDMEAIGNYVLNRVESQLDLKSFYENDNKLMEEINGLKKLVDSQQIIINNLNTTMCGLVHKLDVNASTATSISPVTENMEQPTFPSRIPQKVTKDVISDFLPINEDNFKPMTTDEDNFEPMTTEEDNFKPNDDNDGNNVHMAIEPVD